MGGAATSGRGGLPGGHCRQQANPLFAQHVHPRRVPLPRSPDHPARSAVTVGSQVDRYLTGLSKKAKFSGVVAVSKHGTILVSKGYGMADRAHRAMNRPDTLYPGIGGSMGYSILAVVQLIERGKVKEGNGICTYISGCPAMWQHLTVRSALTGRAGLPDIDWESSTGGVQQAFATCKATSLGLPTGAQAHFANCGTYVLAAIISRMTGKPWATALRDNIWKPAGMSRTGRLTHALKPPRRAAGYSGSGPGTDSGYENYYLAYSNVLDVQRYDQALFGARLVGSRWLQTMMTPQAGIEPPDPTSPMWMPAAKNLHY